MPPSRKWVLKPQAPPELAAEVAELPAPLVQALYNRGLATAQEMRAFLQGREAPANPFLLKGMNRAVARLRQALKAREPIAVYGDFDVDGLAATAILAQTLRALGGAVIPYIPRRLSEGYGLNAQALTALARQGAKVVVTVDCGIRSLEEVGLASELGMEVIITDHHSLPPELPRALAIVNPKQEDCPYPQKDLSGAALAFRLAQGLLRAQNHVPIGPRSALSEEELLDLVALGTVADMVPLWGENRELVKKGLSLMKEAPRPGLAALLAQAGLPPRDLTSQAISYRLAPRLNAAGRLDRAEVSLELLLTREEGRAVDLAAELEAMNRERQALTEELAARALEEVRASRLDEGYFILLAGPEYFSGVSGLVAARLVEEFYRPALVLEVGEEYSRGSARSIPEFNLIRALDSLRGHLTRYGGHTLAAGLTLPSERIGALAEELKTIAAGELAGRPLAPELAIDAELPLEASLLGVYRALGELSPFGYGNPEPLFLAGGVEVKEARRVGTDHLRLTLTSGGALWEAIAFGQGHWLEGLPPRLDLAYSLQMSTWQGEERLELRVEDLRPAQGAF